MSLVMRAPSQRQDFQALGQSIGAQEILSVVFRHRGKVLLALMIPPVIAVTLLFVLPPVYRAQSDILVKTGREYLATADGDAGLTAPTSTKQEGINSEMELLTSRPVVQATIDAVGLQNLYPALIEDPPLFGTIEDAAVNKFGNDLIVEPVKLSNIISVSFDAASKEQSKTVLDKLIQVYIARHIAVYAGSRADSYEESIKTALGELGRLEAQRTRIKIDGGIYDIGAQRSALITQRVEAESHLQGAINNQATLNTRLAYLMKVRPTIPRTSQSTNTDKSDESIHSREALADLRQVETSMAARYADGNPDLERVRAQIETLKRTLGATASERTTRATVPAPLSQQVDQEIVMDNAELAPLAAEITRYQELLTTLTAQLHRLEEGDLALRTTVSQIDAMTDNLKTLQARYQQARTQEQTDIAKQVSVVQVAPAMAADKPAKPKNLIFLAGGILFGMISAGGVMLLSVVTNKTIVTEDAARRLIGLPVLVSLDAK